MGNCNGTFTYFSVLQQMIDVSCSLEYYTTAGLQKDSTCEVGCTVWWT